MSIIVLIHTLFCYCAEHVCSEPVLKRFMLSSVYIARLWCLAIEDTTMINVTKLVLLHAMWHVCKVITQNMENQGVTLRLNINK